MFIKLLQKLFSKPKNIREIIRDLPRPYVLDPIELTEQQKENYKKAQKFFDKKNEGRVEHLKAEELCN